MATNQMAPPQTGKTKIVSIERTFNLTVSKLWEAWTTPDAFKKWWGPAGFTCPYCSINLERGGKYLNCMHSPEGQEMWGTGIYKEIIPNKKLVYTDSFADKDGNIVSASSLGMPGEWPLEMEVTVVFKEENGKAKMNIKHVAIPVEMYEDCIKGWQQCFDKLETSFA